MRTFIAIELPPGIKQRVIERQRTWSGSWTNKGQAAPFAGRRLTTCTLPCVF